MNAPLAVSVARAGVPEALVREVLSRDPPREPETVLSAVKVVRIILHCLDLQLHASLAMDVEGANRAAIALQRVQACGATRAAAAVLSRPGTLPDARVICVGILEALVWHATDTVLLRDPPILDAAGVLCRDEQEGPACRVEEAERMGELEEAARAVAEAVAAERADARLAQAGAQLFLMLASSTDGRVAAAAARGCGAVVAAMRAFPAHAPLSEVALSALEAAVGGCAAPLRAAAAEALTAGGGLAAACAALAKQPDNAVLQVECFSLFRTCLGSERAAEYAGVLHQCGAPALARAAVVRFRALVQLGVEQGTPQHPATGAALTAAAAVGESLQAWGAALGHSAGGLQSGAVQRQPQPGRHAPAGQSEAAEALQEVPDCCPGDGPAAGQIAAGGGGAPPAAAAGGAPCAGAVIGQIRGTEGPVALCS